MPASDRRPSNHRSPYVAAPRIASRIQDVLAAANAAVPKLQPDQMREMMEKGNVVLVDVRDAPDVQQSGKIRGAVNVSRGMLEFRADPTL